MRAGRLRAFLLRFAIIVISLGMLAAGVTIALRELGREREIWGIALSVGGALILALAAGVIVRGRGDPRKTSAQVPAAAHLEGAREALSAIALTIGRGRDLVETAEETLDAVGRAVGVAVGIVYRLDASSRSLVLLAQRGIEPEMLERARTRPLEGSYVGQAARTGTTLVTDLTTALISDEKFRQQLERLGYRTQLALPIPVEDRIWGVLVLVSTERRELAPDELTALGGIAHQVGLAVHRAELADTAAARLRRLEALREIERHISEQLDLDRLLVIVARSALSLIGGTFSIVFLREGDVLRAGAWAGIDDWIGEIRIPVGAGLVGQVLGTGEGLIANDYASSPLALEPFKNATLRLLAHPLVGAGQGRGVMLISRDEASAPFTAEDLSALADLATQASVAIDNARLFAQTRRSAEQYQALFEVAGVVGSTLDIDRIIELIVDRCRALMGVAAAGLFRLDEAEGTITCERGVGFSAEFVKTLRLRVGEGTTGRAVAERAPVWSGDLLADPAAQVRPEVRALVVSEGYRAVLSVPVIVKGRVHGALAAYWWEPRAPSPSEIALMTALAGQAGLALDNARLYGETAEHLRQARALLEVAEIIESTLDPQRLLEQVATATARVCGVDRVSLERWDGEHVIPLMSQFADGRRDERLWAAFTGTPSEPPRAVPAHVLAMETRRPVIVADVSATDLIPREWAEMFGHKSSLIVPLIRQDQVIGVMTLDYTDEVAPFLPWQVSLAAAIAGRLALSIDNARLSEEKTLAHADLAAAQDQLVRTEKLRAMGEMASGMAHDFNNVLAAILGRAQLLLGRVEDPALRQWLLVIERAATDGARTVRRLQEFTRIRRDQPAEPVDWNRIVEETLEATELSWRDEPRKRGVAIEVETALAESLPPVSGDPAELREALTNLILNAVDAMPGGGRLRLATRSMNGHVEVTVADTGTGIAAEIRDRIFDPFFTTKGPKGTGLGLSMTYGILARHDGRITVESEEGCGTTFRLAFSASDLAPAAPAREVVPSPVAGGLRCLIVDDEAAVAEVLGDILGAIGHEATVVGSGVEALARLREGAFDLVLTDLAMPEMTGWEVARAVKALAPGMPVVLVTGFAVEIPPADVAGNGVDLVLPKPLAITDIETMLAQVKSRRGEEP